MACPFAGAVPAFLPAAPRSEDRKDELCWNKLGVGGLVSGGMGGFGSIGAGWRGRKSEGAGTKGTSRGSIRTGENDGGTNGHKDPATEKGEDDDNGTDDNDPKGSATKRSREGPLYYPDYLKLNKLLDCQEPVSFAAGDPCHDEMLFITVHQTYELWFKQLLFELDSVRNIFVEVHIGGKGISLALHRLARIKEIQKLLTDQIQVLETMTPQEFLDFRDYLFPASGFQSFQFRLLEVKFGVRQDQRLNEKWVNSLSAEHQQMVRAAQAEPSLFDYVERWLRNMPFREFRRYKFAECYEAAVKRMFETERENLCELLDGFDLKIALENLETTRTTFESVYKRDIHERMIKNKTRRMGLRATNASLMILLYQDMPMLQLPARLLRTLVDIDEQLNQWRYRHSQMVHKMIGGKIGTGGSLGHSYLKRTINSHRVFADLANLSTLMIPRRLLPELPAYLRDQLKYFHSVEKYDRTLFEIGGGGDSIDWSFCC